MKPKIIIDSTQLEIMLDRLCRQLIENHGDFAESALIGIQPRGIYLSRAINERLKILGFPAIRYGELDPSFYRDDFRRREHPIEVRGTSVDFSVENLQVILVDDVLYTGRTIRSSMDALMDMGRPAKIELLVLVERRFRQELPINADYVGQKVNTVLSEVVEVRWEEFNEKSEVLLLKESNTK